MQNQHSLDARPDDTPAEPLAGLRVLILAQQFPGPFMGSILADLGADVVIVEHPDSGDPTRRFPGCFETLNRNRRAVALDLKSVPGRAALLALARSADALIEGFRPGVMDRLNLSTAALQALNPDLIIVSISAFGQTGPDASTAAHDLAIQARAGLVHDSASWQHDPLPLADISSAMYAVIALLAGLIRRAAGARGCVIDVAMLESLLSWQALALVPAVNNWQPAPYPPRDPGYGVFEVRGGRLLALSIAGEDRQWQRLCESLGMTDLAGLTAREREGSRDQVVARLRTELRSRGTEICETLVHAGVSATWVRSLQDVAHDAQVVSRNVIVPVAENADARALRQPILFDGRATAVQRMAPRLGQHTREVLMEVGCPEEVIADVLSRLRPGPESGDSSAPG
jgi:crotonobetainyl-CoA:carnitine CoA-transferase CaiB-like acyl-CoA transferase